jgi:hypothetical protein
MLNTLLQHLRISPKPETKASGNPDEGKVSAAIETAKEAMNGLAKSTLEAILTIREMVSSIGLPPFPEVMRKAWEGLCFVIGLPTTPVSNTVSAGSTTG